jgi:hypothetical protein
MITDEMFVVVEHNQASGQPHDQAEIFRLAATCVEALVNGLNDEVGPLLERLER